jgi:hypothetical protein
MMAGATFIGVRGGATTSPVLRAPVGGSGFTEGGLGLPGCTCRRHAVVAATADCAPMATAVGEVAGEVQLVVGKVVA